MRPPQFPTQHLKSSQPTSIEVGLLTALIYMSVLGVVRVRWFPLAPACTPVPESKLPALYLNTTSDPLDRISGLSCVGDLTYTAPSLPLLSVLSSPKDLKRILKGSRMLSRKGLYHCRHLCCRVLHRHYLKLLQIEPDVALIADFNPSPKEGVGHQGHEEAILFDRTSQEKIFTFLL